MPAEWITVDGNEACADVDRARRQIAKRLALYRELSTGPAPSSAADAH